MNAGASFAVDVLNEFRGKLIDAQAEPKRKRAKRDWRYFLKHIMGFELEWFHEEGFEFQLENNQTLILAPRGHGKTYIFTIGYILWRILRNPDIRILIVSATNELAEEFSEAIRGHIESKTWTGVFGDWKGSPWKEGEFSVNRKTTVTAESTVNTGGILGTIQGGHYDLVICDDLVSEDSANSEKLRAKTKRKFLQTLLPTLLPGGELHIVGTRYHWQDLYGGLVGEGGMLAGAHKIFKAIQDDGSALWEKFQPLEDILDGAGKIIVKGLNRILSELGTILFNAQYQNDTRAMKGKVFKAEWFEEFAYDPDELPPNLPRYQGVDPAIGLKAHNDWFVVATLAYDRTTRTGYVIEVVRRRLSWPEQPRFLKQKYRDHNKPGTPVVRIAVESNAYQVVLQQHVRFSTNLPVVPKRQIKDKVTRAQKDSADYENGRIRWPRHMLGGEAMNEFLIFPDGDHDDMIDGIGLAKAACMGGARTGKKPRGF